MTLSMPHVIEDHAVQDNFDRIAQAFPIGRENVRSDVTVIPTKAGVPSDADYTTPPPVGTAVLNTSNNRVYYRVTAGGLWKSVALT